MVPSRSRALLAGALAIAMAPTAASAQTPQAAAPAPAAIPADIAQAVAAPTRVPANVQRDRYRHPAETLAFFGVTGGQTVLEYFPAGGWYLEILAPMAAAGGGHYIAAQPPGRYRDQTVAKIESNPEAYGATALVDWPAGAAVADGSVDTVLTFRNVHNMVMGDEAPATFAEFFRVLKPGGVLGIVDHRLPEDRDGALERKSGYLKVSTVRRLAEAAGFVLESSAEINANPRDTADWAKGVWTLPPTLADGADNRERYLAVGESDRMTLRFRKPAA